LSGRRGSQTRQGRLIAITGGSLAPPSRPFASAHRVRKPAGRTDRRRVRTRRLIQGEIAKGGDALVGCTFTAIAPGKREHIRRLGQHCFAKRTDEAAGGDISSVNLTSQAFGAALAGMIASIPGSRLGQMARRGGEPCTR